LSVSGRRLKYFKPWHDSHIKLQAVARVITKEQALQKLRHYCGYQERCHSEAREKLYNLGVRKTDYAEIISTLIEEGYLNEERFAIAFAGGKFRIKKWGKKKIQYELKQKQVSEYCIKKALKEIDHTDYLKTLQKLYKEKWTSLKGETHSFVQVRKTVDHLLQKGYERDLIMNIVNKDKRRNNQ
jgi:regulatory protein